MYDARTLGQRVLLSRRDLGIKQKELERSSGVSRSRISEIERGKATNLELDSVYGLAQALGVTVSYLLGLTEDSLGESDARVLKELSGEYLTVEVDNQAERLLLQEAIDVISSLSSGEQRRALQLLRMLRQIEEDDQDGKPPRIVE